MRLFDHRPTGCRSSVYQPTIRSNCSYRGRLYSARTMANVSASRYRETVMRRLLSTFELQAGLLRSAFNLRQRSFDCRLRLRKCLQWNSRVARDLARILRSLRSARSIHDLLPARLSTILWIRTDFCGRLRRSNQTYKPKNQRAYERFQQGPDRDPGCSLDDRQTEHPGHNTHRSKRAGCNSSQ